MTQKSNFKFYGSESVHSKYNIDVRLISGDKVKF